MKDQIKKIVMLIIIAFAVRLLTIFVLQTYQAFGGDSPFAREELDRIALNIISGRGYVYPHLNTTYYFFGDPLYAYIIAFLHWITNKNYLALAIFQSIIAALSIMPLFFIANKIFDRKTAFISAWLYCLHPGLIVYAVIIGKFALMVGFLLILIYLIVCHEIKRWNLLAIGILMGLGLLLRPTLMYLIPAVFIYLLSKKEHLRDALLKLFVIILLTTLVISPRIYRGYKIYHRFIFIASTTSEILWRGNNPLTTGTGYNKDGIDILSSTDAAFKKKLFSLTEMGQYDFFKEEAIKYIKNHPADFLKLTLKKFIYFWSFSPTTGFMYPKHWLIIYKLWYYFLAFFFILGIYFNFKKRNYNNLPLIIFLFSFFLIFSFFQSIFYVDTRHRWLIEPLLMIFSGYGIVKVLPFGKLSNIRK